MYPLKQSTSFTGQFFAHDANGDKVDSIADGSWTKRISKAAGTWAAMTVTITFQENGWYTYTLSTSHTDTLGLLSLTFTATGAKQVNLQFRVHARIFDDLAHPGSAVASVTGAVGSVTGNVGGNVVGSVGSVSGHTPQTGDSFARIGANGAGLTALGDTRLANLDASVASRLAAASYTAPDNSTIATINGKIGAPADLGSGATVADNLVDLYADIIALLPPVLSGTADSGSTTTMVDAAALTQGDDYWNGSWIVFTSGTLINVARLITDFDAATDTITFAPAAPVAVSTHTYKIIPAAWVAGAIDIGAAGLAQVKAQVVAALITDTYGEPGQGAPGVNVSLKDKIGFLFKAWRNKSDQTGSLWQLYDDAGTTVDQKRTADDTGTQVNVGEVASGP